MLGGHLKQCRAKKQYKVSMEAIVTKEERKCILCGNLIPAASVVNVAIEKGKAYYYAYCECNVKPKAARGVSHSYSPDQVRKITRWN